MSNRFPTHQLSNGLYVSGRPELTKEKTITISSTIAPYTGGDIPTSGELEKMIDANVDKIRKSGVSTNVSSRNSSFNRSTSIQGQLDVNSISRLSSSSVVGNSERRKICSESQSNYEGEQVKKSSGSLQPILPSTGLLTSDSLNSTSFRLNSGRSDHNHAITNLSEKDRHIEGGMSIICFWSLVVLCMFGFALGASILTNHLSRYIVIYGTAILFVLLLLISIWNKCWGKSAVVRFIARYPDADLRTAQNDQYVKVNGVVTCGAIPLETSLGKIPRCVYTSSRLYEYRSWESNKANPKHRRLTWGLRFIERYVADFYISDDQSGLRALVKTGHGAKVTPYVKEKIVADMNTNKQNMNREFSRWLNDRKLSGDQRRMHMKEGYIKEGNRISVMGVLKRNSNNMLTIVPPSEPFSTGCQWTRCILPTKFLGIVLACEDNSDTDCVAV